MVEARVPAILGPGNSNLPQIFRCLALYYVAKNIDDKKKDVIEGENRARLLALLQALVGAVPREALMAAWQLLTPDEQTDVKAAGVFPI